MNLPRAAALVLVLALALAACSNGPGTEDGDVAASASPRTPSAAGTDAPPSTSTTTPPPPSPSAIPSTPTPPDPVSIQALIEQAYDGRDLRLGEVLARDAAYTRYFVTYASGDLTISGVMNIPAGDGPFPTLVLNHGYIDPTVYTNGRGMMREQDYLARNGFAVLHTDYRNHAQSSPDPDAEVELRLGYTEDVINAVLAVKSSGVAQLDPERVGLFGRSMGGGVTYNALVARPGLVDAAVVYAPVSSDAADNFDRWIRGTPDAEAIVAAHGAPEDSPDFWYQASARPYFDRITEPVLIQHGTADESCPYEWSLATRDALVAAGADAELVTWEDEPHAFEAAWPASMEQTVAFFREHLA